MWCIIKCSKWMSHRMNNTKTYIRKSHTSYVLT